MAVSIKRKCNFCTASEAKTTLLAMDQLFSEIYGVSTGERHRTHDAEREKMFQCFIRQLNLYKFHFCAKRAQPNRKRSFLQENSPVYYAHYVFNRMLTRHELHNLMMLCKQGDESKAAQITLQIVGDRHTDEQVQEAEQEQEQRYAKQFEIRKETKRGPPRSPAPKRARSERTRRDFTARNTRRDTGSTRSSHPTLTSRLPNTSSQSKGFNPTDDMVQIISASGALNPVNVAVDEPEESDSESETHRSSQNPAVSDVNAAPSENTEAGASYVQEQAPIQIETHNAAPHKPASGVQKATPEEDEETPNGSVATGSMREANESQESTPNQGDMVSSVSNGHDNKQSVFPQSNAALKDASSALTTSASSAVSEDNNVSSPVRSETMARKYDQENISAGTTDPREYASAPIKEVPRQQPESVD
eukprot:gb/GECG01014914.1/.p1 GENE.gb/GECG01014914.1/~~gb/GECG01014914.1/.p1  ORF type:complete len:419 (+),score=59.55 gb/GECG01014914.1/:1-1257(+)